MELLCCKLRQSSFNVVSLQIFADKFLQTILEQFGLLVDSVAVVAAGKAYSRSAWLV